MKSCDVNTILNIDFSLWFEEGYVVIHTFIFASCSCLFFSDAAFNGSGVKVRTWRIARDISRRYLHTTRTWRLAGAIYITQRYPYITTFLLSVSRSNLSVSSNE